MAQWIEFAMGRYNDQYETLYCEATTREYNGKQYKTNIYNADTKQSELRELEIILRDKQTGEELKVEKFQITPNKHKSLDWHPTHRVQVKLGQ